jgi:hypothetical protein
MGESPLYYIATLFCLRLLCYSSKFSVYPRGDIIAVDNMVNGVDWYSLTRLPNRAAEGVLASTMTLYPQGYLNARVPVLYICGGDAAVVGSSQGAVHILNIKDGRRGTLKQTLRHVTQGKPIC